MALFLGAKRRFGRDFCHELHQAPSGDSQAGLNSETFVVDPVVEIELMIEFFRAACGADTRDDFNISGKKARIEGENQPG